MMKSTIQRMTVLLTKINPPSPWFDIIEREEILSVIQVVRMRYYMDGKNADSLKHWATHRFCVNRFMKVER